jgi:hypothetical protein
LQLEDITARIDRAFGDELPFSRRELGDGDLKTLYRVFGDVGYQHYLQDQVSRQIIRDYLTNAVLLGYLSPDRLDGFANQVATQEGRSALSLHMLMTSVEDAASLPGVCVPPTLKPLNPGAGARPKLSLVPK